MSESTTEVDTKSITSLTITDKTQLTQRVKTFGDGEDGYFMQQCTLYADSKDTGVTFLVTGNTGKDNVKRIFTANGNDYDNPKDALIAAGHEWKREG